VTTLEDLARIPGASLATVASITGADLDNREPGAGYQRLAEVDAIDAPGGARVYARGEQVLLVYVGTDALPAGTNHQALARIAGSDGETLRSRQGKSALMHVVADKGIAWSEDDGEVGFVELFPPTTLNGYQKTIYREPPKFIR
jgi:hypothetical protein